MRVPPLPEGPIEPPRRPLSSADAAFARSLVIFEDDHVLVLDKPAGLAVQGGTKTIRHLDGLLSAWGEGDRRPRLVHRLDRDTSGVLALGKTASAAAKLSLAFAGREARKTYWAIVAGSPEPPAGQIEIALAKIGSGEGEQMSAASPADPRALFAKSLYVTLARSTDEAAWLALRPITGRTHQLRAHLLALGYPILGDPRYHTARSRSLSGPLKLQLHARRLQIPHPAGGAIDIAAPPSPELRAGMARFGFDPESSPADPFAATG